MPKEKNKYSLEILSSDGKVLYPRPPKKEITSAYSEEQAKTYFWIRSEGQSWRDLWLLDSVTVRISKIEPVERTNPPESSSSQGVCVRCGSELDIDYCQNCGWRKLSQWYSKFKRESANRIGKKTLGKE